MAPASEAGYGTAYHFRGHGWVRDPAKAGFTNAPWSPRDRRDMDDFVHNRRDALGCMGDAESWLDSIHYYDLLDKPGYGPQRSEEHTSELQSPMPLRDAVLRLPKNKKTQPKPYSTMRHT